MNIQIIKTLIKRELWENKTSLLYTPLIIALLVVVTAIGASIYSVGVVDPSGVHISIQTDDLLKNENLKNYNFATSVSSDPKVFDSIVAGIMMANCTLQFLLFSTVLLAYVTRSMFEDRKSRDILFWRSMPVSETANVLTKVGVVLLSAPIIITVLNLAVIIIMAVLGVLLLPLLGANMGALLSSLLHGSAFYAPLKIGFKLLLVMMMLLPIIGFSMLASAFAKKSPFLISISPALLVLADIILQKLTGINIGVNEVLLTYWNMLETAIRASAATLAIIKSLAICVLVGAGILVATIWLRNNRYEI